MNKYNRYKIVMTNGKEYVVKCVDTFDDMRRMLDKHGSVVFSQEVGPYLVEMILRPEHISTIHPLPEE